VIQKAKLRRQKSSSELEDVSPVPSRGQPPVTPRSSG